ncbi:MAG: hypothetical protein DHS80DRAFT_23579 [Piptocephalis tieghemiana]|nr:MAG: hypothetical protein DHS80DRAFT_23579 [Piptocephalis tieghemiana]
MLPTAALSALLPILLLVSVGAVPRPATNDVQDIDDHKNVTIPSSQQESPETPEDGPKGVLRGLNANGRQETIDGNADEKVEQNEGVRNPSSASSGSQGDSITLPHKGDYLSFFIEDDTGRYYLCQADGENNSNRPASILKIGEPFKRCIFTYDRNHIIDDEYSSIFRSNLTQDVLGIHPRHYIMVSPYDTMIDGAKFMYNWDLQFPKDAIGQPPKSVLNGTVQAVEMVRRLALNDQNSLDLCLPPLTSIPGGGTDRTLSASGTPGTWYLEVFGATLPKLIA